MTTKPDPQPDNAHADIGMVCSLPMEVSDFLARCGRVHKYTGGDFVFLGGRYDKIRIAIVECGVGYSRARRAAEALIDAHSPQWLLSVGFSGALEKSMKVGHIVMANEIIDSHGQKFAIDLHASSDVEHGLHVGRIYTADAIVHTIAEKQHIHDTTGAIAVDLESLAVAQVARERKTRFMAVRTISDDMSEDLPPEVLSVLGGTGAVRIGAALGALWKRPSSMKDMLKLREQAQTAAKNLADFLDGVVHQLHSVIPKVESP